MQTLTAGVRPANPVRRVLSAIEPSYNWGESLSENMDGTAEGPCRYFEVEWLGISCTLFFGRTPKRGA
jgi:hypothetical protein